MGFEHVGEWHTNVHDLVRHCAGAIDRRLDDNLQCVALLHQMGELWLQKMASRVTSRALKMLTCTMGTRSMSCLTAGAL